MAKAKIFGTLNELMTKDPQSGEWVFPFLVSRCFEVFEKPGFNCQASFIELDSERDVKSIGRNLEKGKEVDFESLDGPIVCALFRRFITKLSEPLLTAGLVPFFIEAQAEKDAHQKKEKLKRLVQSLPPENHALFKRIVLYCASMVAQQEEKEGKALAKLIAQFLGSDVLVPAEATDQELKASVLLMFHFIQNSEAYFGEEAHQGEDNAIHDEVDEIHLPTPDVSPFKRARDAPSVASSVAPTPASVADSDGQSAFDVETLMGHPLLKTKIEDIVRALLKSELKAQLAPVVERVTEGNRLLQEASDANTACVKDVQDLRALVKFSEGGGSSHSHEDFSEEMTTLQESVDQQLAEVRVSVEDLSEEVATQHTQTAQDIEELRTALTAETKARQDLAAQNHALLETVDALQKLVEEQESKPPTQPTSDSTLNGQANTTDKDLREMKALIQELDDALQSEAENRRKAVSSLDGRVKTELDTFKADVKELLGPIEAETQSMNKKYAALEARIGEDTKVAPSSAPKSPGAGNDVMAQKLAETHKSVKMLATTVDVNRQAVESVSSKFSSRLDALQKELDALSASTTDLESSVHALQEQAAGSAGSGQAIAGTASPSKADAGVLESLKEKQETDGRTLRVLESDLERVLDDVSTLMQKMGAFVALAADVDVLTSRSKDHDEAIASHVDAIAQASTSAATALSSAKSLAGRVDLCALGKDVAALAAKMDSVEKLCGAATSVEADVKALAARVVVVEEEKKSDSGDGGDGGGVGALQSTVEETQRGLDALTERVRVLEEKKTASVSSSGEEPWRSALQAVESEGKAVSTQLKSIESRLGGLDSGIVDLKALVDKNDDRHSELLNRLGAMENTTKNLAKANVEDSEALISRQQQQSNHHQDLVRLVGETAEQGQVLTEKHEALSSLLRSLEQQIVSIQEDINNETRARTELAATVEHQNRLLTQLETHMQTSDAKQEVAQSQHTHLSNDVDNLTEQHKRLQLEFQQLEDKHSLLSSSHGEVRDKVSDVIRRQAEQAASLQRSQAVDSPESKAVRQQKDLRARQTDESLQQLQVSFKEHVTQCSRSLAKLDAAQRSVDYQVNALKTEFATKGGDCQKRSLEIEAGCRQASSRLKTRVDETICEVRVLLDGVQATVQHLDLQLQSCVSRASQSVEQSTFTELEARLGFAVDEVNNRLASLEMWQEQLAMANSPQKFARGTGAGTHIGNAVGDPFFPSSSSSDGFGRPRASSTGRNVAWGAQSQSSQADTTGGWASLRSRVLSKNASHGRDRPSVEDGKMQQDLANLKLMFGVDPR